MSEKRLRIVLDINVFLSGILWPQSPPGIAYRTAVMSSDLLISEEFEQELEEVVRRPKFDPALLLATRLKLFNAFVDAAVPVVIRERIAECRDIKDNKVLELAVSGNADLILTGDKDLLVLHPFRGIPILNPLQFLALHAANDLP